MFVDIFVPIMKNTLAFFLLSVTLVSAADSLQVSTQLSDSTTRMLIKKQKKERINSMVVKMKNIAECNTIKDATVEEIKYCRDRYAALRPEEFGK